MTPITECLLCSIQLFLPKSDVAAFEVEHFQAQQVKAWSMFCDLKRWQDPGGKCQMQTVQAYEAETSIYVQINVLVLRTAISNEGGEVKRARDFDELTQLFRSAMT